MTRLIVRLATLVAVVLLGYFLVAKPLLKSDGFDPQRLVRCVKHAKQDTKKIERCARRL